MPEFLITACWILLFLFFIYRFRFFEVDGINKKFSYAAFGFKLLLGFANYYIWLNIIGHGDSLRYVQDSDLVYHTLWSHPADYFQLLIGHSKEHVPEHLKYITENLSIEWHVSEYNMVRLLAVLNLFSFGSAWGNIAILSFFSFIASIALFKTLIRYFETDKTKKRILYILIFFIPSIVFWSSALLKEGPSLILLSILFIQLLHLENQYSWKRIFYITVTLFLLWLVRDYLLFLILPNLLIFFLLRFYRSDKAWHSLAITLFFIVCIAAVNYRDHFFTGMLKDQQTYFLENPTDPDYHFRLLDGSMVNLISNIPYSFNNILFRPNLLHSSDPFRIYQAIELILTWVFTIFFLFRFKRSKANLHTQMFFLLFCLELLFIYGILVTDADTLSRYRTVPLFFLLIVLVSGIKRPDSLQK
jgi:hypothetical protein